MTNKERSAELRCKPQMYLDYYTGVDSYSDGDTEEDVLNYITDYQPEEYEEIFTFDQRWGVYYYLTSIRENLLNWYTFKEHANVLEVGAGMGALTHLLCDKCEHVTAVEMSKRRATAIQRRCRTYDNLEIFVGDLTAMEFEQKFDYITVVGVLEYQTVFGTGDHPQRDFLKQLKGLLAPGGKILIAIENKMGLKYWAGEGDDHSGQPFDSINNFRYGGKAKTLDRQELIDLLGSAGIPYYKFYYPMGDYKLPTKIFTDGYVDERCYLMTESPLYSKFLYSHASMVIREEEVRGAIVRNGVFSFFANSFLVEAAAEEVVFDKTKFVSIAMLRTQKNRIYTHFDGEIYRKVALTQAAKAHVEQTYKNAEYLKKQGIHIVPQEYHAGVLSMPVQKSKAVDEQFKEAVLNGELEKATDILDHLYALIQESSELLPPEENGLFKEGKITRKEAQDCGPVLKVANLELNLQNCLEVEGKWQFFDQEWVMQNIPATYILARAIDEEYHSYPSLSTICPASYWNDKYQLTALEPVFQIIGQMFLANIIGHSSEWPILQAICDCPEEAIKDNIWMLTKGFDILLALEDWVNKHKG
ncbi:class I SAM-dependent methyltransferase [Lachnospiraceae bacterium ZAX-1]